MKDRSSAIWVLVVGASLGPAGVSGAVILVTLDKDPCKLFRQDLEPSTASPAFRPRLLSDGWRPVTTRGGTLRPSVRSKCAEWAIFLPCRCRRPI